jgi:hypothetical protein
VRHLAKVGGEGSNPFARSPRKISDLGAPAQSCVAYPDMATGH